MYTVCVCVCVCACVCVHVRMHACVCVLVKDDRVHESRIKGVQGSLLTSQGQQQLQKGEFMATLLMELAR